MKKIAAFLVFFLTLITLYAQDPEGSPLEGRWDLVVDKDGKQLPSWLEVEHSGTHTLVGRFVYAFGSARPVSVVHFKDGKFDFSIPPQWEPGTSNMDFAGELIGNQLKGTMVFTDGKTYNWTGVRAPELKRNGEPQWGTPITLLNTADSKNWHTLGENQWTVSGGVLQSAKSGSNLITDQTFTDFKLHIEFRIQKGSNSGVYLRGRYETQIVDTKVKNPAPVYLGAIYGFLTPSEIVAPDPGVWQSYDITLTGRMITIVANGITIVCNQEIPGITGGALDSKEGEPGPIMLQGDHGPIEFRNIVITPAK